MIIQNYDIMQTYEPCCSYILDTPVKTNLGKRGNQRCRYCGNTPPRATFRMDAHTVPHLTGNRSLFSWDECDECNKYFSETVEDQFAKFFNPMRTMLGISGYGGVPSYKTRDHNGRIDAKDKSRLAIKDGGATPFVVDDPENKKLSVTLVAQPHLPIFVYKCLVKMAIAILPESELQHFTRTIQWLMERDPVTSVALVPSAVAHIYDFPVQVPNAAILLRRRVHDLPLPYMLFNLTLERLMFSISLPLTAFDDCFDGPVQFNGMGPITVSGKECSRTILQMASANIVKDQVIDFSLSYQSREEADKPT